ncbi:MAG: pyridoxamine 5'-phosphate oxidase [Alphaproteobacteria bacterium]|nr:pyridoxamine 5'-phosphate oxidase [Alphaproteobacteria bacterium]
MDELTAGDFTQAVEPFELFKAWFAEAIAKEINDPSAMALSTVDANGLPDVRMVLMKEHDEKGFVFYTNSQSTKGGQLAANMKAAANFHWKSLRRQVRIRGPVEIVPEAMSDAYFASRPRDARIGAWASQQSKPLESRFAFEKAIAATALRYPIGEVPRPPHWIGYRIRPLEIEFWHDRPFRLHDRVTFKRDQPEGGWNRQRLFP